MPSGHKAFLHLSVENIKVCLKRYLVGINTIIKYINIIIIEVGLDELLYSYHGK